MHLLRKFQRADVSQSERAWTDVQSWGGGGGGAPQADFCLLLFNLPVAAQLADQRIIYHGETQVSFGVEGKSCSSSVKGGGLGSRLRQSPRCPQPSSSINQINLTLQTVPSRQISSVSE